MVREVRLDREAFVSDWYASLLKKIRHDKLNGLVFTIYTIDY